MRDLGTWKWSICNQNASQFEMLLQSSGNSNVNYNYALRIDSYMPCCRTVLYPWGKCLTRIIILHVIHMHQNVSNCLKLHFQKGNYVMNEKVNINSKDEKLKYFPAFHPPNFNFHWGKNSWNSTSTTSISQQSYIPTARWTDSATLLTVRDQMRRLCSSLTPGKEHSSLRTSVKEIPLGAPEK